MRRVNIGAPAERESRILRKLHVWCRMFILFRARQIFCVCTISQFIDNLFRNTENCFLFARSALAISHRRHKHSNTKCVPSRKPATTNINSKSRSRFQIIAAHLHFAEIDLWMSSARHSPVPGGLKLMFAPLGMKKQFWYDMVLK